MLRTLLKSKIYGGRVTALAYGMFQDGELAEPRIVKLDQRNRLTRGAGRR